MNLSHVPDHGGCTDMSGQTYKTVLTPPPDMVGEAVRRAGMRQVAGARMLDIADVMASLRGLAVEVPNSSCRVDAHSVRTEIMLASTRVALTIEQLAPGEARFALSFADSQGVPCADERRLAAAVIARLCQSGFTAREPIRAEASTPAPPSALARRART